MDPFTAFTFASTALNVAGGFASSNAEAQQFSFEGKIASQNAKIAQQNAESIRLAGAAAEEAKRRQIRKDLGRSAAAMSEAGVGAPSEGSNARLLKQAGTEAEYDAQALRYGYESQAYGQDVEAINQTMAAEAARRRARGAKTSGWFNAASTILSAGSSYSGAKAQQDVWAQMLRRPYTSTTPAPTYGSGVAPGYGHGVVGYGP